MTTRNFALELEKSLVELTTTRLLIQACKDYRDTLVKIQAELDVLIKELEKQE